MPDTYYLNNDSKNWKIHLNNLIAPNNENLKIISKQQDLILQDNFKITNDIINLQKKVAIEGHLDTTNANVKIPITFNNFSFCDPSNMQSVLTKTDNEWIDLSGFGYKIEVTPQSERSSIYLRMKINFFSSHQAGQLISFALYRDISGGANSEELFVDMNFGTDSASSNNSIYTAEFIDDPSTNNNVCYYLKYKLSNTVANNIDVSSGVLGYDNSNINFLMTQELYKPQTDGFFNEIEPAADICLNIYDYIYNKEINANFKDLTLTGNTIKGDISINGIADISNNLNINQILNAHGGIRMISETPKINNINIIEMSNSNITNCKKMTVIDLSINDSATINGIINANNSAHIINNVDISGDISINGLARFKNGLTINSDILIVNEGINMNNNNIFNCDNAKIKKIDVSNITSLTGLLTANSDITITGLMNLFNSNSDISSGGDLSVNKSTTLNSGLNTDILNVIEILDLCDNNIIDCNLLSSNKIEVTNDASLNGTLTVNNEIIVNNNVTISGDLILTNSSNDISGIDLSDNKILKCSEIQGPNIIIIDPAAIGDNTGKVSIKGGLVVNGLNTNIESIDVELSNNGITIDLSNNLEGGFIIKNDSSIDASFVYNITEKSWKTYDADISLGNINITGNIIGDISCNFTGSISGESVTTDSISGNINYSKFASKTITTQDISDNTITANEIANNMITVSEILDNTITATQIKDKTILEANIADDSITAIVIAPDAITSSEISNNSITASVIAANAITSDEISNNSILNENIDTISGEKIVNSIYYEQITYALTGKTSDTSVDISNTVNSGDSSYNGKLFNVTNGCLFFYNIHSSCWKKITTSLVSEPLKIYTATTNVSAGHGALSATGLWLYIEGLYDNPTATYVVLRSYNVSSDNMPGYFVQLEFGVDSTGNIIINNPEVKGQILKTIEGTFMGSGKQIQVPEGWGGTGTAINLVNWPPSDLANMKFEGTDGRFIVTDMNGDGLTNYAVTTDGELSGLTYEYSLTEINYNKLYTTYTAASAWHHKSWSSDQSTGLWIDWNWMLIDYVPSSGFVLRGSNFNGGCSLLKFYVDESGHMIVQNTDHATYDVSGWYVQHYIDDPNIDVSGYGGPRLLVVPSVSNALTLVNFTNYALFTRFETSYQGTSNYFLTSAVDEPTWTQQTTNSDGSVPENYQGQWYHQSVTNYTAYLVSFPSTGDAEEERFNQYRLTEI